MSGRRRWDEWRGLIVGMIAAGAGLSLVAGSVAEGAPRKKSKTRIVRGVPTTDYPAAGVLLRRDGTTRFKTECSGTLIGCRSFLTAAHCFEGNGPDGFDRRVDRYRVFFQHAGFFNIAPGGISLQPGIYRSPNRFRQPNGDIALVRLDRDVEGIEPAAIPADISGTLRSGDRATIVGFGKTHHEKNDFGIKRFSTVVTSQCQFAEGHDLICWDFEGAPADPADRQFGNTCGGDSGGGLFASVNQRLTVFGVTSGGSAACASDDHAYDTDVARHVRWLRDVASGQGDTISTEACGAFDALGTGSVGRAGRSRAGGPSKLLSTSDPELAWRVKVEPGTKALRIAMNGEDDGGNDFAFSVMPGTETDPEFAMCTKGDQSQYAICEIADIEAGDWTVSVSGGAGEVQLTVTHLREANAR